MAEVLTECYNIYCLQQGLSLVVTCTEVKSFTDWK